MPGLTRPNAALYALPRKPECRVAVDVRVGPRQVVVKEEHACLGSAAHHRAETAKHIIPEGWQQRHIAGIPPGCNSDS